MAGGPGLESTVLRLESTVLRFESTVRRLESTVRRRDRLSCGATDRTATDRRRTYRPGIAPNSSVDPNPSSAPASAVPLARASVATAAATAGATSRLNTEGMM